MVWTFKVGTLINEGCSVDVGETIREKTNFVVGETIHARYDTARTENTPYPSWMRWFRYNTNTNQWDLIYESYPDRAYGCGNMSWISPPLTDIAGKYFVGYGVPDTPDWKASKTIYIESAVTEITITKLGNGAGKVTAKIGTIEPGCTDPEVTSISVPIGQWVTFKACPNAGSRFVKWQNGSTDPILYAYADAPGSSTITATFEIDSITVSSVYFLKNGVADFNCQVTTSDNISFTASATGLILGQRYKCEWKVRKDTDPETSFFSDLVTASLLTTFNSIWNAPVTVAGSYTITYVTIYNELNIPVWAGAPP